MSDLDRFELFVYIVEAGGVTQAAKQLGVTKASLSRQLKRLEGNLSVDLFIRYKQRLQLTEMGKVIFNQCQRLQRELDDTRALCRNIHEEPEGILHIVALDFFARQLIYPKLEVFLTQHPKLNVFVDTSERLPHFEKEQVDIAVGFTMSAPPDIVQRRLQDFRYVMAASPEYFQKYGYPKQLADLINHRYIGHKARDEIRDINLKQGHRFPIKPNIILNNVAAMIHCAKLGLGIIQLPSYLMQEHIDNNSLEEVLPQVQANHVKVYCYYPRFRYTQPKVRKFLDFILN